MSIEAEYRVTCDSRGGLCRSQTEPHEAPDPAIYEALEAGWWLSDDDGMWHCPLCGIKPANRGQG